MRFDVKSAPDPGPAHTPPPSGGRLLARHMEPATRHAGLTTRPPLMNRARLSTRSGLSTRFRLKNRARLTALASRTGLFAAVAALICGLATPVSAAPATATAPTFRPGGFEAGNILSDDVMYRADAMSGKQIRLFIKSKNARCKGKKTCLRKVRFDVSPIPADQFCAALPGRVGGKAGTVIADIARACGINPQVMLVLMQIQTGLLSKASGDAVALDWAVGWNCPTAGSGDVSTCDPAHAGFVTQLYGMAHQFAENRIDPGRFAHQAGATAQIAYSAIPECGAAPVAIENTATASLYNLLPYQPNDASLAGFPGLGDACSSYEIRNIYFIFSQYFGLTGGGAASRPVVVTGKKVTVPASPFVPDTIAGKVIKAPTKAVARGIAAGLASIGLPYVWGGGTYGGPADEGCVRGQRGKNACQGVIGFDCSGLTAYVLRQSGFAIPGNSTGQRADGKKVRKKKALAGDIIGYPGHVTVYLGEIAGVKYMLEAPDVGKFVRISVMYQVAGPSSPMDKRLHRYWK